MEGGGSAATSVIHEVLNGGRKYQSISLSAFVPFARHRVRTTPCLLLLLLLLLLVVLEEKEEEEEKERLCANIHIQQAPQDTIFTFPSFLFTIISLCVKSTQRSETRLKRTGKHMCIFLFF